MSHEDVTLREALLGGVAMLRYLRDYEQSQADTPEPDRPDPSVYQDRGGSVPCSENATPESSEPADRPELDDDVKPFTSVAEGDANTPSDDVYRCPACGAGIDPDPVTEPWRQRVQAAEERVVGAEEDNAALRRLLQEHGGEITRLDNLLCEERERRKKAEERVEELEEGVRREREALRRRNETMFAEGEVEVRYAHDFTGGRDENDDRPVDEVVGRGVYVHLEYLGGQWFLQVGDKRLHLTDEATRTADERVDWLDDQPHDERQRRQEAQLRVDELQDELAFQHGDSRDYWQSEALDRELERDECRAKLREARGVLRDALPHLSQFHPELPDDIHARIRAYLDTGSDDDAE